MMIFSRLPDSKVEQSDTLKEITGHLFSTLYQIREDSGNALSHSPVPHLAKNQPILSSKYPSPFLDQSWSPHLRFVPENLKKKKPKHSFTPTLTMLRLKLSISVFGVLFTSVEIFSKFPLPFGIVPNRERWSRNLLVPPINNLQREERKC